jgi:hypothetical protein
MSATPPNEKTGFSYAQVAASDNPPIVHSSDGVPELASSRPPLSSKPTSPPTSYASAVEKPSPEERRRIRADREAAKVIEEQEKIIAEERAERRRRRRERDEQERRDQDSYEEEKKQRRKERRERKDHERREAGGESSTRSRHLSPHEHRTEKIRQDGTVTSGTDASDDEEKPSLVSAIQKYVFPSFLLSDVILTKRSRVHWAPLNIPLPRRLQTAAVLWHTLSMTLFFSFFWFVLAIPLTWPIMVPYLIYVFFLANNHADGSAPYKRSEWLRNLPLWRLYTEYFPIRLHRTVELDPSKNYIFAYHPHGIISHGAFGNFCTEATGFSKLFPGIKNTLLTIDNNFNIPFYREYLLALGLASVSKRSCEALLRGEGRPNKNSRSLLHPVSWFTRSSEKVADEGGRAITIVIGGARESLEAHPGSMKLVCKKRRGFLKLAMREGAGVVPVLSFGENGECFHQSLYYTFQL